MPQDTLQTLGKARKENSYDAIVIGSGISGGWAAKELCEKGLKTLVLERGRDVKHLKDYPTATLNPWDLQHRGGITEVTRRENPLISKAAGYGEDNQHFFVQDKDHPYIQEKPFDWIRGYQVGGKSITWGRCTQRWSEFEFTAPAKYGYGLDWPIRYRDVAPWYSHVEKFIGVAGSRDGLESMPDGEFLPPFELNCVERHLKDSISKNYGRHFVHARWAHLTKPQPIHLQQGRGQCQARNLCMRGCPFGGYFSSNSSTLPWAERTGNLTIRPHSVVHSIIFDEKAGKASGVRVIGTKPYQIVVVPVLAPLPIAWVSISFVIGDATARALQRVATSDVSFVQVAGGESRILATTLGSLRRAQLAAAAGQVIATARDGATVRLGEDDYEVLATPLEDTGQVPIYAIVQRSTADGLTAYFVLEAVLLFIAGLSLAVTLAGAIRIAGRITRPVAQLGAAAQEIERGNYSVRVDGEGSDEIGELGRVFDRMAAGLAERDNMRDVLGKVASNEVVARLLEGGDIELGGEEREVTVMFTDIRNFTAIVEQLTADQSLQLLNEFLTVISELVDAHGGVVDKYLGDGVMALFGAPITREDDAQRALACALEIRRRVEALGPVLAQRNLPHPQVGIGINTSRVIAGNIGSPSRLNYTVLGDGVNLASRLEGLTKRYHVPIVVGHATREKVRGVVWRELDKVRVRGKTVPERIFEPLVREGELDPGQAAHLARWHEALEMFRLRRWEQAAAGFRELAQVRGYERITFLYLGYVRDLEANPPGEGWDAAFTLYEK